MKTAFTSGMVCLFALIISNVSPAQTWTSNTTENSGLASNRVMAIVVDDKNATWFGTANGLSRFDGRSWTTYTTEHKLAYNTINALAYEVTSYGPELWIGTNGGGVSRYDGVTSASPYDTAWSAIASDTIYAAFVDSKGTQWFGTDEGVSAHAGHDTRTDWTTYTAENGLVDNAVLAIAEDMRGVMWFGTRAGVSSFDGERWTTYTTADGLAGSVVNAIAVDRDGSLWFGADSGVSRYGGGITAVDSPSEPPSLITIDSIYPNPFNPSTTISFSLPSEGNVSVDIHALSGQKVRSLVSGSLKAGTHSVGWNGRDDRGKAAASGVYLVRLTMGGITASQQMTLVK